MGNIKIITEEMGKEYKKTMTKCLVELGKHGFLIKACAVRLAGAEEIEGTPFWIRAEYFVTCKAGKKEWVIAQDITLESKQQVIEILMEHCGEKGAL